jgi:hypothetical protein
MVEGILQDTEFADAVTVPFVVEGALHELELHVLNGACPFRAAQGNDAGRAPLRRSFDRASGTLVGFVTDEPPGVLTHHGSRTHVHVLVESPERISAHVDRVTVAAGSVIRVPAGR